ncbi:MAG TPA: M1 family aminopeptidase [Blastocatellia bacterium]|nr:M1 family aminopeptidase [Blastocatellia bacterium]
MRKFFIALVVGLLLAPVASAQNPERDHDLDVIRAIQRAESRPINRLAKLQTEPDTSGFDIRKYTLRYNVNFNDKTIAADVTIDAASTVASLSSVNLDFIGFTISSVTVDGAPATFSRTNGAQTLSIALPNSYAAGATFAIEVTFSGRPLIDDEGLGFGFNSRGAATFAEPEGARLWYPCKDRPSDKAQYEGFITVPTGYVVASNGRLVETTSAGSTTTYHWLESHQIATYLIDFAISNYAIIDDALGDLPVQHFVYPEVENSARRDFSRTPEMIQTFEDSLGVQYPFDKYGHALFENFGGAMEHQSCTSYGSPLVTGDNRYDRVVAHELGHQWFGDLVSPAEWEEIWLNEGFASWMEYLWTEHADPAFLPQLMASRESYWEDYENNVASYALYNPPRERLFGTTIYQKGGWVVAMLRYQIGDEAFFAGMRDYLNAHAQGNATTSDFRAAMEAASGQDLSAFFEQWVYTAGYPQYETSWSSHAVPGGTFQADVRIRQKQSGSTTYTIPLEIEAVSANGTRYRERVEVTSSNTIVSICVPFEPRSIVVDPDNRVLGPVDTSNATVPAQPNVCGDSTAAPVITAVRYIGGGNSSAGLEITGQTFVVGDSRVEVNGVELTRTKYPKRDQNPDGSTTVLVGKQKKLGKDIVKPGVPVQVTVVNVASGLRSAPFTFTR